MKVLSLLYIKCVCTNPGRQVTRVTKLVMVASIVCVSPVWNLLSVTLLAPRILRRILDFCTPDGYDVRSATPNCNAQLSGTRRTTLSQTLQHYLTAPYFSFSLPSSFYFIVTVPITKTTNSVFLYIVAQYIRIG